MAFKREDWNELIRRINDLAQNPDSGCDPVEPLEEVGPNHKWSKSDIQATRDKLLEICADNEFAAMPAKWTQSIIEEINVAIEAGWCGCDDSVLELSVGPKELRIVIVNLADPPNFFTPDPEGGYLSLVDQAESDSFMQRLVANMAYSKLQDLNELISEGAPQEEIDEAQAEYDDLHEEEMSLLGDLDSLLDAIYAIAVTFIHSTDQYYNVGSFLRDIRVPIQNQSSLSSEKWDLEINTLGEWETLLEDMQVSRSGRLIPPGEIFEFPEPTLPLLSGIPMVAKPIRMCISQIWSNDLLLFELDITACVDSFPTDQDFYLFRVVRYRKDGTRIDFI